MPTDVIMPALGMAQETGKVVNWLKAEGETVAQGEPLLEIETDKVTVEIEAPASGTLARVTAAPGDDVPVGCVIAMILTDGEPVGPPGERDDRAAEAAAPRDESGRREQAVSPVAARIAAEHDVDLRQVRADERRIQKADVLAFLDAQPQAAPAGRVLASPKARRLADERGVELVAIAGSGPAGAVLAADVIAMVDERRKTKGDSYVDLSTGTPPSSVVRRPSPDDAPSSTTTALSTAWRIMAERTAQSWTNAPHFYLLREVDASRLKVWLDRAQRRAPSRLTYTDLLVKLVAAALREHPRLNAAWRDGAIVENGAVNVGLAVAVEDALLVPVIHGAGELSLGEIASRRRDLVDRAQAGKLRPEDLCDGTFTISNLGMYGVDAFNAIVNPPQAAILAVGRIAERVVAVDGQPAVRPTLVLSLSCDHRVVDGARGARFLDTLADLIEEPLGIVA